MTEYIDNRPFLEGIDIDAVSRKVKKKYFLLAGMLIITLYTISIIVLIQNENRIEELKKQTKNNATIS
jgi:hypothetical protein